MGIQKCVSIENSDINRHLLKSEKSSVRTLFCSLVEYNMKERSVDIEANFQMRRCF